MYFETENTLFAVNSQDFVFFAYYFFQLRDLGKCSAV